MGTVIKSNLSRLRAIFLYYDSEPMEILQGFIWLLLFIPITIIVHGFNWLTHPIALFIGLAQIYCVLNCTLNKRKIVSFIVFLWTLAISISYFISGTMIKEPAHLVFAFVSLFAFFNLKRLTIQKLKSC